MFMQIDAPSPDFWETVRPAIKRVSMAPSVAPPDIEKPPPSPPPRSRNSKTTTIPHDEAARAMCLNIQGSELRFLVRLYQTKRRERGEPFVSQADMIREWGINRNILYETDDLGRLIGFTIEEDEFIGHNALNRGAITYKRKGKLITIPPEQFLRRITPSSETPDETKARRAKSKQSDRSKRRREVRAEQRAITKALRAQAGDVDCRPSAVSVILTKKWTTIEQLGKELAQSCAFRDRDGRQLVEESLHRAINRTLKQAPLCDVVETRMRIGKFGNHVLHIRRRP